MPQESNPYYFRAANSIELDKYEQAISDLEQVAGDTTTNTHALIIRNEAFKMLKMYDTTIQLCNRLLSLKYDSTFALSQRGLPIIKKVIK
jgi:tetratricopeptide (TPR) repeat protein